MVPDAVAVRVVGDIRSMRPGREEHSALEGTTTAGTANKSPRVLLGNSRSGSVRPEPLGTQIHRFYHQKRRVLDVEVKRAEYGRTGTAVAEATTFQDRQPVGRASCS